MGALTPLPLQPPPEPLSRNDAVAPNPIADIYLTPEVNGVESSSASTRIFNSKKKKKFVKGAVNSHVQAAGSSSSSSSTAALSQSSATTKRRIRVPARKPRLLFRPGRVKDSDVDALALPIGMSIAAVFAQVLERDAAGRKSSADHLSGVCTLAVKESLKSVFGYRFDGFVRNFEKSFRSTLLTLSLVNESSEASVGENQSQNGAGSCSEVPPSSTFIRQEESACSSGGGTCQPMSIGQITNELLQPSFLEDIKDKLLCQQLTLHHGQIEPQLACVPFSKNTSNSDSSRLMMSSFRKSVMEQTRSNDLKEVELCLVQKKLQLEERQLGLMSEANTLDRCKLSMGYSKASFKAEKFKTQLEDTRHAELLRKCLDCLVVGLVVMLSCLGYGIYIYSVERITEATASCMPTRGSKSWWMPQPVSSFNSAFQILRCHVQVFSRIVFSVLMVFTIIYLLIQRSASSNQTMPLTFILLLLGVACGIAGKFCVDTLGGSGYHWLLFWETLCALHFLSNVWTSMLYRLLYGPVSPLEGIRSSGIWPYLIRRIVFYVVMLLFLPLLCGLIPFASLGEWKDHFFSLLMSNTVD